MKFYEVQPLLEAGKRIRLPYMKGFLILDERFDAQPKIRYILNGCSTNHCISENELLAEDWEIVDDIPEIQLFQSKEIRYSCPKCGRESEQIVYPEDKTTAVHKCHYCGQKFRFKNLEEMKEIYYDMDSKLLSHKKYLEEWKAEIEEIMSRENSVDVSMRSIKYQELYLWSIRVGVIDECLEHIKEMLEGDAK